MLKVKHYGETMLQIARHRFRRVRLSGEEFPFSQKACARQGPADAAAELDAVENEPVIVAAFFKYDGRGKRWPRAKCRKEKQQATHHRSPPN